MLLKGSRQRDRVGSLLHSCIQYSYWAFSNAGILPGRFVSKGKECFQYPWIFVVTGTLKNKKGVVIQVGIWLGSQVEKRWNFYRWNGKPNRSRQAQGCYSYPKPHCHSDQGAWRQHGCSFQREVVWEPAIGDHRDCPSEAVLHPQRAAGPGTN